MKYKDIRLDPTEEKEKVYGQIDNLFLLQEKQVKIKEHKSGFPAVTVDCEDIHVLTDIISLEQWWMKSKGGER